jgi:hypothetical protein
MAFNVRPGGNAESVPVVSTIVSGDVVRCGAHLVGIAQIDAELGRDGVNYTTLAIEGIAHAPVAGAVVEGTPIYTATAAAIPGVVAVLTTTATAGAKLVGIATRPKAGAPAGETWFKLVPNATLTV